MHFHLPKPLHGWREFAGEIGIIVLGVLIALGLEQVAEAISWKYRANDAREALRAKVGHGFLLAEEREVVADCVNRQLDNIEGQVLAAGSTLKPLPANGDAFGYTFTFRAPLRSWAESAWQGVITDGISPHLDLRERENLPVFYSQMSRIHSLQTEEETVIGDLLALSKPLSLDPQVRASFVREIEAERVRNRSLALTSTQAMRNVRNAGYVPSERERRDWLTKSGTIKFCRGLGLALGNSHARS